MMVSEKSAFLHADCLSRGRKQRLPVLIRLGFRSHRTSFPSVTEGPRFKGQDVDSTLDGRRSGGVRGRKELLVAVFRGYLPFTSMLSSLSLCEINEKYFCQFVLVDLALVCVYMCIVFFNNLF